jgi:GT2 family glycosyltransferase
VRILAHIHTLNDEDVIGRSLPALLEQEYRLEEILLVDNASTDGTLKRPFPPHVTVIQEPVNLGTSGAVATGFRYALERGYDWIWILDADSIVEKDTLSKLVELYGSFPPDVQASIGSLSSRIIRGPAQPPDDYGLLTAKGPRPAHIDPRASYYESDAAIWSGSLFSLRAVRETGSPRYGKAGHWDDFCLDWGDVEYFYRLRQAGYKVLVHRQSTIRHALGWQKQITVFGRTFHSTNHAAFRRYLYFRNQVYFWLYTFSGRRIPYVVLVVGRSLVSQTMKILFIEDDRVAKIRGMLRGVWDGVFKKLHRRY